MPNDEYGTPFYVIESARIAMGSIDFDPFSSNEHNKIVRATHYFKRTSLNAFNQLWKTKCNLWMNPPFSKGNLNDALELFHLWWILQDGNVSQAMVLVNNATETAWFQRLAKESDSMCMFNHRISFILDGEVRTGNNRGQVLFYFGIRQQQFANEFEKWGFVL